MTNGQMPFALAMDLNGTGTLVDVTTYVRGTDGLQKTGTKQDQFRDSSAATFTFVLENYDGRFTPGNTATYVNPPTERMTVNWSITNLGALPTTTYHAGSILTMTPTDDNWTGLVVTCDDMLGAASRNTLTNPVQAAVQNTVGLLEYWPLTDAFGSSVAANTVQTNLPLLISGGGTTFGVAGPAGNQLNVNAAGGPVSLGMGHTFTPGSYAYTPATLSTLGYVNLTVTPTAVAAAGDWTATTTWDCPVGTQTVGFSIGAGGVLVATYTVNGTTATATTASPLPIAQSVLSLQMQYTLVGSTFTYTVNILINGVLAATGTSAGTTSSPGQVVVAAQILVSAGSTNFSSFSASFASTHEEYALSGFSEANRLTFLGLASAQTILATLPTDLSTAPLGAAAVAGQSALDALNAVIRTEQGYMDCQTTGSLTAPVQSIRIRARQRPATVSYSFDAQQEIDAPSGGTPIPFIRDSTNLIWSDSLTGANSTSQVVSQTALQARAGSNNASDTVGVYVASDLYEWGSDRLWRGSNVALRPQTITIDNRKLATDRSADLNAMVPGDRIRITNIPSTILGFTTWDGWLLDKDEDHRSGLGACDRYILYLQPCQPTTGIFDTDLFDDGANNLLTTAMTNVTTSCIVGSVDGVTWFEQSTTGYYIQIDSEVMKVTAAAAPSGGNQTLTVTRAQNSTTAATHAIGAAPEVVDSPADVLNNALFAY